MTNPLAAHTSLQFNLFGRTSIAKLAEVSKDLQAISYRALHIAGEMGKDFSIIEGHRSLETQKAYVATGVSQTMHSKHIELPSAAIDFVPWHKQEGALTGHPSQISAIAKKYKLEYQMASALIMAEFQIIAMCYLQAASNLQIPITWGGDWNRDSSSFDTSFQDWGHIELYRPPSI